MVHVLGEMGVSGTRQNLKKDNTSLQEMQYNLDARRRPGRQSFDSRQIHAIEGQHDSHQLKNINPSGIWANHIQSII